MNEKLSRKPGLSRCPSCNVEPCTPHRSGCDVERCSVCGLQRVSCKCDDHDPLFARWTGLWPGDAEAILLGFVLHPLDHSGGVRPDLNRLYSEGYHKAFFIKPVP